MAKHTDPICKMPVEEATAAGEAEYQGRRYYFCSGGCRERFHEEPGRYAAAEAREDTRDGAR